MSVLNLSRGQPRLRLKAFGQTVTSQMPSAQREDLMNAIIHIASIIIVLIIAHGIWVLAYAASPRRVLEERLRAYATVSRLRCC